MIKAKPYLREVMIDRDSIEDDNIYPFNIPSIRNIDRIEFHEDVTFFVGENGTGKSTLIEGIALALGFGIEGGTKNVQMSTHDNASILHRHLKLIKSFARPKDHYFLRAESFYNVASYMEEVNYLGGYGGKSLHESSHGEAFMSALTNKLRGNGLYVFDEPEAALSPTRQLSTLAVMHDLVKKESQIIMATHSPILLAYPNAIIYQLSESGIDKVKYEETEHYKVTRHFLQDYKGMLKELLD